MDTCKKCGAPLLTGSKFCGRCGTAVNKPIVQICPTCKNEVLEGFVFCNKCGTRLVSPVVNYRGGDSRTRTLIISRDSQFQCAGNTYKVVVNGNSLGNVSVGGALRTIVSSDTATVEIICTTIMNKARRRLVLRLGENPRISFKVEWPGAIQETVHDATILERQ